MTKGQNGTKAGTGDPRQCQGGAHPWFLQTKDSFWMVDAEGWGGEKEQGPEHLLQRQATLRLCLLAKPVPEFITPYLA